MNLIPNVLIASRSDRLRQRIFENLIPLKFNITPVDNFETLAKDDIFSNYHLAIIHIETKTELETISQQCPKKKNTRVILISSLKRVHFDQHNIDCYLTSDFNEVDIILKANELLCNMNMQMKIMDINKQILSRRMSRKQSTPLTKNDYLKNQVKLAGKYALEKKNIFISGPAGSGKSRFVDYIFNNSPIEDKNYLYINCKKFSEKDIEDLLFDDENGVKYYTDYLNPKYKGIVYLDHVTGLNLQTQSRLAKRIRELSNDKDGNKTIQFVATSIFKCQTAIEEFLLLPSLARLLCDEHLFITPLNQRREDIVFLFNHFVAGFCKELNQEVPELSIAVKNFLNDYNWPGEIKQLKKVAKKYSYLGHKLPLEKFKKLIYKTVSNGTGRMDSFPAQQRSYRHTPEFLRKNLE
ncbi:MAG: sigma 54-interacting transcriptional regulator [Fidelibacterota bacterium]